MFSLSLFNFIYSFFLVAVYIFLPLFFQYKGLSTTEIGLVLAIGPLVSIFSQPFWGVISDKYQSIKKIIILLLMISIIIITGLFAVNHVTHIIMLMFFLNFFMLPIQPLTESLSIDYTVQKNKNYGLIRIWASIGFAIASYVVGSIMQSVGIGNIVYLMLGFGIISLASTINISDKSIIVKTKLNKEILIQTFKNKEILMFLFIIFTISLPARMNETIFSLYLISLGGSESDVGLSWGVSALSEVPMLLLMSKLLKKFNHLQLLSFSALMYAIRWLLYGIFPSVNLIIYLQVLQSLTFAIFFVSGLQYISTILPKEMLATGQTLYFAIQGGVAGILGNSLAGFLMDAINPQFVYKLAALLALIGSTLCYFTYRLRKKKSLTYNF